MPGEKTEAPTPKRLREARQRGNVSRSQEVVSIGVLLVAVVGMRLVAHALWNNMANLLREGLGNHQREEFTQQSAFQFGQVTGTRVLLAMAPLFAMLALGAVALNMAQTGLILSSEKLKPKLSHVNPGAGLKRIVSIDGLVNLAKALLKMAIIAIVVYMTVQSQMSEIAGLAQFSVGDGTGRLAALAFDVAIRAAVVLFILAVGDYAWQRRKWLKQMRMTKEEIRQEFRESDGDPQVKQAIRRKRQSLMNRMIAAVPKADVVVTNPTHFAVALKYDPVSMGAPVVVAKGQDLLAKRIREVAEKAGVPVLEEPPLARALFAAVAVGHPIPANVFHAVAEVLAWVYALRSKTGRGRSAAIIPVGSN
jgi:flagellar biosynthetic protein FlhB